MLVKPTGDASDAMTHNSVASQPGQGHASSNAPYLTQYVTDFFRQGHFDARPHSLRASLCFA